jgi:hypothetical protein
MLAIFGFLVCLINDLSFGWWVAGFICLAIDGGGIRIERKK